MSKPDKPAAEVAKKPSLAARLRNLPQWVREHRIKAAIAFSVVFSILGAGLFTWAVTEAKRQHLEKEKSYRAADAFAALDADDLPEAINIAKLLQKYHNTTMDDAGTPAFVYGYDTLQRAEDQYDLNRRHSYKIAAHWFEEALRRGLPEDRRNQATYLCGKTLVLAERYVDALPVLLEALQVNPDHVVELNRLLAVAYFQQADPNYAAALATVNEYLLDRDLSEEDRTDGYLLRAELSLQLDERDDAVRDLDAIPAESKRTGDALILRARLALAEADALQGAVESAKPLDSDRRTKLDRALELAEEARKRDLGLTAVTPRASYLAGLAYAALGKIDEAAEAFHQTYRRSIDGAEGIAAQLQSAHLARLRKRNDTAVSIYVKLIDDVGNVRNYRNRWLSLTELKRQMLAAYDDFFARHEFASADALADVFPKIFDEDYAVHLAAEAQIAWAKSAADPHASTHTEEEAAAEAREHYREAGKLFERLATLRFATREYPEHVWISAKNYSSGADYANAARQFRKYLEIESRGHHAEALVGLAEVLLVQERHDQALSLLKECLAVHPRDPASYQARLLLAKLYGELNQWDQAEAALTANLEAEALTPSAAEWRHSLFALGRLLYDVGRYEDAVVRLDEAIERYPKDAETIEARYRSSESHRRLGQSIEREIPVDALPTERAKFAHRAREEYAQALAGFDETIRVARAPSTRGLDAANRNSLLRNALFSRGSILHALGRYDESIRAHQTAIASFPNSPAALDAYLQMVDCYRRLDRRQEARGTLEQAKLMLNRLPQDAAFETVSNYSRQEWVKLLDTLGSL